MTIGADYRILRFRARMGREVGVLVALLAGGRTFKMIGLQIGRFY
jgi:hypothetical protein